MEYVEEMDKFVHAYEVLKLAQEAMNNLTETDLK
jgi:hypothetical protein